MDQNSKELKQQQQENTKQGDEHPEEGQEEKQEIKSDEIQSHFFEKSQWIYQSNKKKQQNAPCKRWGHTSVLQGKSMYIYGGHGDSKKNKNWEAIYRFDSSFLEWEKIIPVGIQPEPRNSHAACRGENLMYIYGGNETKTEALLNDLWVFNFQTNSWKELEQKGDVPKAREGHQLIMLSEKYLLLMGGWDSQNNTIFCDIVLYDIQTNTWKEVQKKQGEILEKRESFSVTLIKDHLYIFGGQGFNPEQESEIFYNDLYKVKIDLLVQGKGNSVLFKKVDCTSSLQPPPRGSHSACCYLDRFLVIHGGEGEPPEEKKEIVRQFEEDKKKKQQEKQKQRDQNREKNEIEIEEDDLDDSVQLDGLLFPKSDVYIFDTELNFWLEINPLYFKGVPPVIPRFTHTASVYKDQILIFGGMQTCDEKLDALTILQLKDDSLEEQFKTVIEEENSLNAVYQQQTQQQQIQSQQQQQTQQAQQNQIPQVSNQQNNNTKTGTIEGKQLCPSCCHVFGISDYIKQQQLLNKELKVTTSNQNITQQPQQPGSSVSLQEEQLKGGQNYPNKNEEQGQQQQSQQQLQNSANVTISEQTQVQTYNSERPSSTLNAKIIEKLAQEDAELKQKEKELTQEMQYKQPICSIRFLSSIINEMEYPFSAFGLILDSAQLLKVKSLNINLLEVKRNKFQEQSQTKGLQTLGSYLNSSINEEVRNNSLLYFQIFDDSEGFTHTQFNDILYNFDLHHSLNIEEEEEYQQDLLTNYGCQLKLAVFRLGNTMLLLSKNKETHMLNVGYISASAEMNPSVQELIYFYFEYDTKNQKFTGENGSLNKDLILNNLKNYLTEEQLLNGHDFGNYTYIFDLKKIPRSQSSTDYEFQFDPVASNLYLKGKGLQNSKKTEYINNLVDYSLKSYLSYLYLDQSINNMNVFINGQCLEFQHYQKELEDLEQQKLVKKAQIPDYLLKSIKEVGQINLFEPQQYLSEKIDSTIKDQQKEQDQKPDSQKEISDTIEIEQQEDSKQIKVEKEQLENSENEQKKTQQRNLESNDEDMIELIEEDLNNDNEMIIEENEINLSDKDKVLKFQQGILLYHNKRLIGRAETDKIGSYFLQKILRKSRKYRECKTLLRYSGIIELNSILTPNIFKCGIENPFFSSTLFTTIKTFLRSQKIRERNIIGDIIAQRSLDSRKKLELEQEGVQKSDQNEKMQKFEEQIKQLTQNLEQLKNENNNLREQIKLSKEEDDKIAQGEDSNKRQEISQDTQSNKQNSEGEVVKQSMYEKDSEDLNLQNNESDQIQKQSNENNNENVSDEKLEAPEEKIEEQEIDQQENEVKSENMEEMQEENQQLTVNEADIKEESSQQHVQEQTGDVQNREIIQDEQDDDKKKKSEFAMQIIQEQNEDQAIKQKMKSTVGEFIQTSEDENKGSNKEATNYPYTYDASKNQKHQKQSVEQQVEQQQVQLQQQQKESGNQEQLHQIIIPSDEDNDDEKVVEIAENQNDEFSNEQNQVTLNEQRLEEYAQQLQKFSQNMNQTDEENSDEQYSARNNQNQQFDDKVEEQVKSSTVEEKNQQMEEICIEEKQGTLNNDDLNKKEINSQSGTKSQQQLSKEVLPEEDIEEQDGLQSEEGEISQGQLPGQEPRKKIKTD